jgi:hypothetical protein
MKKRILTGLSLGLVAGILDLIPMIMQKLTIDADLSAFSMWIVIGFFIAVTDIRIKGIAKGITISILILFPCLFIIGWKEPVSLIPILTMTIILGSILGFAYQRITKE